MNMQVSPQIAVMTNVTPNHLNIHKDYDEYIEFVNNVNSQILALLEHENVKLIYPTIQIER